MPMPVVIFQPPLVQLNSPYPSGAYLAAFFRGLGREGWSPSGLSGAVSDIAPTDMSADGAPEVPFRADSAAVEPVPGGLGEVPGPVRWIDGSELFFRSLFSRDGIGRLFELSRGAALSRADRAERSGDDETAFQLRRYVSRSESWTDWIDGIVSILCGGDRELCHSFIRSPGAPRGARMDSWLAGLSGSGDNGGGGGTGREPTADDARTLATLALEDIADYIAAVYDPEFSLVRYAESIAASERDFEHVEAGLKRPLVKDFMEPLFTKLWEGVDAWLPAGTGRFLLCLSVPFPGTLIGALAAARSARRRFGPRVTVALGGGYVNTELRSCDYDRLFEYVHHLSFDRGYGGYADWFRKSCPPAEQGSAGTEAGKPGTRFPRRVFCPEDLRAFENAVTASIVPDYSDIDFSRYPRLADTPNPMHRLWSDGTWMKAMLAHGCYWHRCSFCDVTLDYIRGFRMVNVPALYAGLSAQADRAGVRGVHFVDEAAPPRALRDFADENLRAAAGGRRSLSFWGNIRFERSFSRDLAEYLSFAGLSAVSGGIEIASEEGFKAVDKGIDLENLVATCAAFKEAGVLVHSYLIYGYWNEDAQGVIDSAETMRQLFAFGLVDSAFWHKFVLTRHSRVYDEWTRGMHRDGSRRLQPLGESPGTFAANDLRFKGEDETARYTEPLDAALRAWMGGEALDRPIRKWFPYDMPAPSIAGNLIETYIDAYERRRDAERSAPYDPKSRYAWTGSLPVPAGERGSDGKREFLWWHLGEETGLVLAEAYVKELCALGAKTGVNGAVLERLLPGDFTFLRNHGLCRVAPLM